MERRRSDVQIEMSGVCARPFSRSAWLRTVSLHAERAGQLRCRPSSSPSSSSPRSWELCPSWPTRPGGMRTPCPVLKANLTGCAHQPCPVFFFFFRLVQLDPIRTVRAIPGAEQHLQRDRNLGRPPPAHPRLSVGHLDLPQRHQKRGLLLFPRSHCYVSGQNCTFFKNMFFCFYLIMFFSSESSYTSPGKSLWAASS